MSINWEELRIKYIQHSTVSLEEIADSAGVDATHVKRTAAAEGWYKLKQDYQTLLHQNATKKLLTEVVEAQSQSIVERNVIRAQNWRILQRNLMAIICNLDIVDKVTGLPQTFTITDAEKMVKVIKDASQALEKANLGERLELGQNTLINEIDTNLLQLAQHAKEIEEFKSKTPLELRAEADAIRERISVYEKMKESQ